MEEKRKVSFNEAYRMAGRCGKYTVILSIAAFICETAMMMYIFCVPLLLIFPKMTGCTKPNGDNVCYSEEEACNYNFDYKYEDPHHDFASEYDLACDSFKAAMLPVVYYLSYMPGSLLWGIASDNYGRLKIMLIGQIAISCVLILMIIIPGFYSMLVLSGAMGFFSGAPGMTIFSYAYDSIHSGDIKIMGGYINLSFALGEIIVAVVLWTGISWRWMMFLISLYSLLFVFCRLKLVESPKYYFTIGKKEEAIENLKYMAKLNGRILPENLAFEEGEETKKAEKCSDICGILLTKKYFVRITICITMYFSCACIYYGISMNVQHFRGNPFVTAILNGIVEVIAIILSTTILKWIKTRTAFILSFIVTGVFSILQKLFENSDSFASLCISTAKFGISAGFNLLLIVIGEIFPTAVKSIALSVSGLGGRLGSVIGPLIGLYPALFLVVSGALCALSIFLSFILPSEEQIKKERTGEKTQNLPPKIEDQIEDPKSVVLPDIPPSTFKQSQN